MFSIEKGSTTMIGSMPFATADLAYESLAESPLTIPTWCQLPRRTFTETMIPMYAEHFPGIKIDSVGTFE
jgi:hypothetical protein